MLKNFDKAAKRASSKKCKCIYQSEAGLEGKHGENHQSYDIG